MMNVSILFLFAVVLFFLLIGGVIVTVILFLFNKNNVNTAKKYKYCNECGTKINNNSKFCDRCGKDI